MTLQTLAAENFHSWRLGTVRRVLRAQTGERGPPSAWAEIPILCVLCSNHFALGCFNRKYQIAHTDRLSQKPDQFEWKYQSCSPKAKEWSDKKSVSYGILKNIIFTFWHHVFTFWLCYAQQGALCMQHWASKHSVFESYQNQTCKKLKPTLYKP